MKRVLSALTALLLVSTFMMSGISASAAVISDATNCSDMEVSVSATDSIGKLLAKDLSSKSEPEENEQNNGCLIGKRTRLLEMLMQMEHSMWRM